MDVSLPSRSRPLTITPAWAQSLTELRARARTSSQTKSTGSGPACPTEASWLLRVANQRAIATDNLHARHHFTRS